MKAAWHVRTNSMDMYNEIGTMAWNLNAYLRI